MALFGKKKQDKVIQYPGIHTLISGASAVVMCERESSDAASSISSSIASTMGLLWDKEKNKNHLNISTRPLISVHPESDLAAAAATAGLSLSGFATHFSSTTQNIASLHELLYAAVGKRLPYVLNMTCTAATKATSNNFCSHDGYHSISDTGFIQFFAHNNQSAADLNLIARKVAELSLNPAAIAQDGFLTSEFIEPVYLPERALIEVFLGLPNDMIDTPTPAQTILFSKTRRRVPEAWTIDQAVQLGASQSPDSYMQSVAGQRPYFFDHVSSLIDQCMTEWSELTGRHYQRVNQYLCKDADYLIIAQGSVTATAEITADFLRKTQKLKVGVVNLTVFRPFAGDLLSHIIKNKKAVLVLERTDQPMSEDLPITTEIRSCISKSIDNGQSKNAAFPDYASYGKTSEAPPLFSASFGLGGREISVQDIVVAIENILPDGKHIKFVYLGIHFTCNKDLSPQQEIQQYEVLEAYPEINNLALSGSNTSPVLVDETKTTRIHSLGGYQINQYGQSLAQLLFNNFNLDVKATPFYGIEKKGQPTTFHLTSSSESFVLDRQYSRVDTVISLDSNIFSYGDPLKGLIDHGILIIQSALGNAQAVWSSFPESAQKTLQDKQIKVYFIDAISIAQDELNQDNVSLDTPIDLQHLIFKAVYLKTTGIIENSEKTDEQIIFLLGANADFIQQAYKGLKEIMVAEMTVGDSQATHSQSLSAPTLLQQKPANDSAIASIHRFWNQTSADMSADPFMALGVIPAATGIFADASSMRTHHLVWLPEKCTGCETCYSTDPDNAVYGLVNTVNEVFETNIKLIEKKGHKTKHLRRAIRAVERKYHELTANKSTGTDLTPIFAKAIGDTIKEYPDSTREEVTQEFEWFQEAQGTFKFALTAPYHDEMNSRIPRSGGLFSITIDPNNHKGGIDCYSDCDSFVLVEQTDESLQTLRDKWEYWLALPTSNKKYSRIDDLQNKQGVLHTLLLDKQNHYSLLNTGNTRSGTSEPIVLHLFTSTITALMQPRVEQQIKRISQLIIEMEKHIRLKLVETMDISDIDAVETAIDENHHVDLTLSRLTGSLDKDKATQPIDPAWLKWALQIISQLKHLKWCYTIGASGQGRAHLGVSNGTDQSSAWASTFPYNPYPFPWVDHLAQHAPSLAMGLFEGHMVNMAEGFKIIRIAELEIKNKYDKFEHDHFFAHFGWRQFSEEEYLLCPPLITVSAEGISSNAGFQSLSSSLLSSIPIKVLVLDNQPSPNPVSLRKELGFMTMAHRSAYVHQGSISNTSHLLAGYIDGLNYKGPALWSVYASSQPENGMANRSLTVQSQLAVESRAYPLLSFDPRRGALWEECIDLNGNPEIDHDWMTHSLDYTDEYGNQFTMDIALTYADWALTEARFSHYFTPTSAEIESDKHVLLTEFIELNERSKTNKVPFIWATHPRSNRLLKVEVSTVLAQATQEQKDFWQTLKGLSGDSKVEVDTQAISDQAQAEMAQTIKEGLMSMMGGDSSVLSDILATAPVSTTAKAPVVKKITSISEKKPIPKPKTIEKPKPTEKKQASSAIAHEPVWIETPDCTTCDECVDIAPAIFQYNEEKKAIVIDPTKGTFEDIVRSAEKCTAVIIHPGTPWNPDEPNLEQLIKRAEQFQ